MSFHQSIDDRLAFLRIDADTRIMLREFEPVLKAALPDILAGFYEHLRRWPDLAGMFRSQAAIDRASQAQGAHWGRLFSGRFDEDYLASVQRIGQMHSKIGLEPRWYIGAYAYVLRRLGTLVCGVFTNRLRPAEARARTAALMAAVNAAVMLDMDLSVSTFLEENLRAAERKLETVARAFQAEMAPAITGLSDQAKGLNTTAAAMAANAEHASHLSGAVAAAAEQASTNVQTVATATEELHASVQEISRQVANSKAVSETAVRAAETTDATVRGLSEAAQRIGDVVNLISDIASQTTLLALNATIEAARAGDAGKGFAVVASEVKSLAGQTAKATEGIAAQVMAIQTVTREAVEAIGGIVETISRMSEIATAIASAVEEQGVATQEIARNIQEVALGTGQVSGNIGGVNEAASETGAAATRMLSTAGDLARAGDELKGKIDRFVTSLRAA